MLTLYKGNVEKMKLFARKINGSQFRGSRNLVPHDISSSM